MIHNEKRAAVRYLMCLQCGYARPQLLKERDLRAANRVQDTADSAQRRERGMKHQNMHADQILASSRLGQIRSVASLMRILRLTQD